MDWLYLIWIFVKAFVLAYWYWCFIFGVGLVFAAWSIQMWVVKEEQRPRTVMEALTLTIVGLLFCILIALIRIGGKL